MVDGYLAAAWGLLLFSESSPTPIAEELIVMGGRPCNCRSEGSPAYGTGYSGREIVITGLRGIASTEGIVIQAE